MEGPFAAKAPVAATVMHGASSSTWGEEVGTYKVDNLTHR